MGLGDISHGQLFFILPNVFIISAQRVGQVAAIQIKLLAFGGADAADYVGFVVIVIPLATPQLSAGMVRIGHGYTQIPLPLMQLSQSYQCAHAQPRSQQHTDQPEPGQAEPSFRQIAVQPFPFLMHPPYGVEKIAHLLSWITLADSIAKPARQATHRREAT